ncbi:DNA-3-methyladenine glycosylase [Dyadobacter sp. CY356]|uniref:DNA-3-methyladenine glycosylase family protein n=1 Tax=Dyadobacter sp. CY356 TaxID=2906442 RepID=UPI001F234627|nr:DNA glycosylase [Dyadobacter sp. CY356]MCF0057010.1 DNA repair protein [Dyadobacter sp. CY356]
MHKIVDNKILKAILIQGKPVLLEIGGKANFLEIRILSGEPNFEITSAIKDYIIDWLDLDRDLEPFYQLLSQHSQLSYMAEEFHGLRIISTPDLFEALCWSVTGQQINLTFAYKLKRRLVEKYGSHIEFENRIFHIFPSHARLAGADPAELRSMQFSSKKAEYIISIAKLFATEQLSKEILLSLPDLEARQKMLMSVKGIGIWTANYALMKSLKEQSSIPYGDAGLLQALLIHNIITDKKDGLQIRNFFQEMRGWESYVVFYLWRSLAKKPG